MKKSQIWSMDAVIAISIFTVVFVGMMMILWVAYAPSKSSVLVRDNALLSSMLVSSRANLSFVASDRLSEDGVSGLQRLDYRNARALFGISSDFCIHFEDSDGGLIAIGNVTAIGSADANLSFGDDKWRCNGSYLEDALAGGVPP